MRGPAPPEPGGPPATAPRALDALRERDYRRFWVAAFVSNTGGWMQNATIPYVVFQLSGSTGQVGVTGFFQYLPFMLAGAAGGSLADRFPRRTLLIWSQVLQAAVALWLWALVGSGAATTASVAALAFLAGLLGGLNTPVWQAFVSDLVPRRLLLGAVTLNSTQFNASRALGPFLAGVVIAAWGPAASFLLNSVSFAAVVGVLLVLRGRGTGRGAPGTGVVRGLARAARHVVSTPAILACCTAIVAVAGLGSPLFSFLPVYGDEVFDVTGARLGLLLGAGGIGAVLSAPGLLVLVHRVRRSVLLPVAMATYGTAVVGVGVAPAYSAAVAVLLVFGAAYLAIASTINTTIQLVVRDELRGTVIAIYLMCLTGALPVGLWVWGALSDAVGLRATTVGAGVLLVLATGVLGVTGRFRAMAVADGTDRGPAGGTAQRPSASAGGT